MTMCVGRELFFCTEVMGAMIVAQDVGGAISGNRIDLYFDSHEDALQWGVQEKIVRWSE